MTKGTFDQLNDALFAQLDKLQAVDGDDAEAMERAIEQTKAVSQLAGNIIDNASTAIRASARSPRACAAARVHGGGAAGHGEGARRAQAARMQAVRRGVRAEVQGAADVRRVPGKGMIG